MIKFFRNIRQKLLVEGKTTNYLKYAIGEIVLVVIGILIALQINNWNEQRKETSFERKVLKEINISIVQNIGYLDMGIKSNNTAIKSCQVILNYFENNLAYADSLDRHFSNSLLWFYPSLNNNAYESLKSYGLHLIKNDSIRNMLGKIYEWKYMDVLNKRQDEYFYSTIAPFITDLFETYEFGGKMKPYDYDELKESRKYKHILRTLISNRELQNQFWESIKNDRLDLEKIIKQELNN
jgi:hypothetical protein